MLCAQFSKREAMYQTNWTVHKWSVSLDSFISPQFWQLYARRFHLQNLLGFDYFINRSDDDWSYHSASWIVLTRPKCCDEQIH